MSIDMTALKYFTRASLPFHTRRKIFGAHEHQHDRAKRFYARIITLPYETNIFRLIWMCDHARVKYLGAVLSMSVLFGTPQLPQLIGHSPFLDISSASLTCLPIEMALEQETQLCFPS